MNELRDEVPDENDRARGKGPPLPRDPAEDIQGLGTRWSKAATLEWLAAHPSATPQQASQATGTPLTTVRTWMAAFQVSHRGAPGDIPGGAPRRIDAEEGDCGEPPPPGDADAPGYAPSAPPRRGKVNVGVYRDQLKIIDDAWREVRRANTPPRMFCRSGELVRVSADTALPRFEVLDQKRTLTHLRRMMQPVVYKKPKTADEKRAAAAAGVTHLEIDVAMPAWIADDLLGAPQPPFPSIDAIVTSPVVLPGGLLVVKPGYIENGRLWYAPPPGFRLPDLPSQPTDQQVAAALALIQSTWLGEFQFEKQRDLAHALALLFCPFVRPLIRGPTPLHLIEASRPGTGKSLLPELIGTAYLGRPAAGSPMWKREEDIQKQLTADLREGSPFIFFDNVKGRLRSASLEAALTLEFYKGRILGVSENLCARIQCTWAMSANNLSLGEELNRRTVRIRLDTDRTAAQRRRGYTIPRIREWTVDHRNEIVGAVLTLLQSWIAAGMPARDGEVLESYEAWSRTMGSLLGHIGVEGLLAREAEPEVGFEIGEGEAFCAAWFATFGDREVHAASLVPMLIAESHLEQTIGDHRTPRGFSTALGIWLESVRGRVFGEFRIERTAHRVGHRMYRVARVQAPAGE